MKTFKTLVVIFALGTAAGSVGAYAVFDVSYTPKSLTAWGSIVPLSGSGAGTAILDDAGLLTMTLQGELIADGANTGGTGYADIVIGSIVQLVTTSSGNGSFSPVFTPSLFPLSASSYFQITSCGYGALETIFTECGLVDHSVRALIGPEPDGYYPYSFYSDQSFTLDGGSLDVQTSLFGGTGVSFLADYELTPASPTEPELPVAAVPEPFSLSLLIPGVIMLATFSRRKAALF